MWLRSPIKSTEPEKEDFHRPQEILRLILGGDKPSPQRTAVCLPLYFIFEDSVLYASLTDNSSASTKYSSIIKNDYFLRKKEKGKGFYPRG